MDGCWMVENVLDFCATDLQATYKVQLHGTADLACGGMLDLLDLLLNGFCFDMLR